MAKKITMSGVVEPKTDADKLSELMAAPAVPVEPELPTPVTETPMQVPTVPTVTPQDVLACLEANPELLRSIMEKYKVTAFSTPAATAPKTRQAYNAGSASAVPTVRKSSQKAGFVEFSFSEKPDEVTRTELKGAGYRWSKFNSVWYGPAATLVNHARYGTLVQAALVA